MNIEQVKQKIADREVETAEEIGKTVDELREIRKVVAEALSQRLIIVARHRRKLAADARMGELLIRHKSEIAELKREIAENIDNFDLNPDLAVYEHVAARLNINAYFAAGLINGSRSMDEYERDLWTEYRRPKSGLEKLLARSGRI